MIDRILRVESEHSITATKNVTLTEDVFADHFFGRPIMPGALLIESLAQASTALIELSHRMRHKAMLIMVQNAKFRALVRPGDQLRIEATIISMEKSTVRIEGSIYVEQSLVMSGDLVFSLRNAEEIYLPQALSLVQMLYAVWLTDAEMVGFHPDAGFSHA